MAEVDVFIVPAWGVCPKCGKRRRVDPMAMHFCVPDTATKNQEDSDR